MCDLGHGLRAVTSLPDDRCKPAAAFAVINRQVERLAAIAEKRAAKVPVDRSACECA